MAATTDPSAQQEELNQKSKITLYWLEQSRSQRILWLLEELSLPYNLQTFKRGSDMRAPPELKEIHPLGKSPVIAIEPAGGGERIVLAESGNIVEVLCEFYGRRLMPTRWKAGKEGEIDGETEEWRRYRYFLQYAEGSLMPFLMMKMIAGNIRKAPVPFFIKPITNRIAGGIESSFVDPNIATQLSFIEQQLSTSPNGGSYLCGEKLTGADILVSFPLEACIMRSIATPDKYPKLCAYVQKLQESEAYKKAVQKIIEVEGEYKTI
ncbi:MAG: hypothetical protein M1834_001969 [Cirrosporium novae-zelandiae]|nr:MAG: hypothetical protein M1834_001969 [Cirrosporium novae-zelandiae]